MGLIGKVASGAEVSAHPVGGFWCPNGLHNNITTLTDTESHDVGGVRLDGHEVVGNDSHIVAVDGEALDAFSTAVDEPQTVFLPGVELEFGKTGIRGAVNRGIGDQRAIVVHLAVDEVVVGEGWRLTHSHDLLNNLKVLGVIVVAEHDRSKIVVVLDLGGPVDNHRPNKTCGILSTVVRVIPRGAVEIRQE